MDVPNLFQDLNPGVPKSKSKVPTSRVQHSVKHCHFTLGHETGYLDFFRDDT
jgi:hypothetical protein